MKDFVDLPVSETPHSDAPHSDARRAIEAVWRIESARLIAGLTRRVGDIDLAEDLAQDALVAALERWPESGVPRNPGAWLMAAAKYRAIDLFRRNQRLERKMAELGHELQIQQQGRPEFEANLDDPFVGADAGGADAGGGDAGGGDAGGGDAGLDGEVDDDLLRLIFMTCHPVLSTEGRVALTLRLLGGLTTEEIARAFLAPAPTVAQRIVRAKRTLTEAHVPFELPPKAELKERLASVLEVIYLIFNEGYSATAGEDSVRPALCEDALRLGRILAGLAPQEAEVHGLAALMEIQASRLRARTNPQGKPVLLLDQNRALWDRLLIQRGLAALELAEQLGGTLGPYTLQAAIAACHARAPSPEETDWQRILALYDALAQLAPSPVVELNRAVALAMAFGPAAGLELVESLASEPTLQDYPHLPSVRADLLAKLGRFDEARLEFERAAVLTQNTPQRQLLLERVAACVDQSRRQALLAVFDSKAS